MNSGVFLETARRTGRRWKKRKGRRKEKRKTVVRLVVDVWDICERDGEISRKGKHKAYVCTSTFLFTVSFLLCCFYFSRCLFSITYSTYITHSLTHSRTHSHSHTHTLCQFPPDLFHLFLDVYQLLGEPLDLLLLHRHPPAVRPDALHDPLLDLCVCVCVCMYVCMYVRRIYREGLGIGGEG